MSQPEIPPTENTTEQQEKLPTMIGAWIIYITLSPVILAFYLLSKLCFRCYRIHELMKKKWNRWKHEVADDWLIGDKDPSRELLCIVTVLYLLLYPFCLLKFLPYDRPASDLIPLLIDAGSWFINSMKAFIVNLLKFLTIERTWKEVIFAVGNWLLNLIAHILYIFLATIIFTPIIVMNLALTFVSVVRELIRWLFFILVTVLVEILAWGVFGITLLFIFGSSKTTHKVINMLITLLTP